mmetsp:Transcript_56513/g.151124  ORF Transcript_56513/g.151124 Transcript_56513/m.151124 type:complete len:217 (-) Transcript_56513:164-814(-)
MFMSKVHVQCPCIVQLSSVKRDGAKASRIRVPRCSTNCQGSLFLQTSELEKQILVQSVSLDAYSKYIDGTPKPGTEDYQLGHPATTGVLPRRVGFHQDPDEEKAQDDGKINARMRIPEESRNAANDYSQDHLCDKDTENQGHSKPAPVLSGSSCCHHRAAFSSSLCVFWFGMTVAPVHWLDQITNTLFLHLGCLKVRQKQKHANEREEHDKTVSML